MGLKSIKYSAKFTKHIIANNAFKKNPFVLVDVGARGGFAPYWSIFSDQINRIGFEPDAKECERINNASSDLKQRVYPYALHKSKGTYPFYITKLPNSSGFYPIDSSIAKRFPILEPLTTVSVKELSAIDFDSFASEHGIEYVDFMKLDTEGSELDILEGAVKTLKKTTTRLGTTFLTEHELDLAASLPLAAAFRELLEMDGSQYYWKVNPQEAFRRSAEELYRILLAKSRTSKTVGALGSDTEYWTQAANVVLRTKNDMLAEQSAAK